VVVGCRGRKLLVLEAKRRVYAGVGPAQARLAP
jgi:hypothetical protein